MPESEFMTCDAYNLEGFLDDSWCTSRGGFLPSGQRIEVNTLSVFSSTISFTQCKEVNREFLMYMQVYSSTQMLENKSWFLFLSMKRLHMLHNVSVPF
jgi:hypothetical protein